MASNRVGGVRVCARLQRRLLLPFGNAALRCPLLGVLALVAAWLLARPSQFVGPAAVLAKVGRPPAGRRQPSGSVSPMDKAVPMPAPDEEMMHYLQRATASTGVGFACLREHLAVRPAEAVRRGDRVKGFAARWAGRCRASVAVADGWIGLTAADPNSDWLKDDQEMWGSTVKLLTFLHSLSPAQVKAIAEHPEGGGGIPFTNLTAEQQKSFWELNRELGILGFEPPPGQPPLDPAKLRLVVSRCASVRVETADGRKLLWLDLFDYTVRGADFLEQ